MHVDIFKKSFQIKPTPWDDYIHLKTTLRNNIASCEPLRLCRRLSHRRNELLDFD